MSDLVLHHYPESPFSEKIRLLYSIFPEAIEASGGAMAHMKRLDNQLSDGRRFLFGDAPTVADFATYHCCWFIHNNEAIRDVFDPFKIVLTWFNRMAAFDGAGETEISSKEALEITRAAEPNKETRIAAMNVNGLEEGDIVEVMPIDYGFDPVRGMLLIASLEELVVLRQDDQLGEIAVHFPRFGFQIEKVQEDK